MTETDLMHEIEIALSERGCYVERINVGKVQTKDGRWFSTGAPKGRPDLSGFLPTTGRMFFIEVKVKPNKPTEDQLNFIHMAKSSGALACVAYSVDDAMKMVNDAIFDGMGLVVMDPAAERLPDDSDLWLKLLTFASDCRELFEALLTVRDCGARLEKDDKFGLRIVPCERQDVYQDSLKMFKKYAKPLTDELFYLSKVGV
ncbi:VRR-NUC domain-containing protein [Acidaminococcus fermentans]|uniref:VRR-NUC domain-containing protein n=1 Tax=Acidaminococcus fermentans TaxID=905 RepID=UPI0026605740|nr:VRR-NUC domain-containing protein [Acidaminococcus fermentans]